jgi:hypothetical protein
MPGTYGIGGLEPCTPCASGTAASVPGALECLPCPAGHAPDAAATDCIPCAPGSFAAAAGTPACHVCPLHTFSATLGATSCEVCPVDAAKVATATQAGEALDSTPTLRTIAPGRTSAAECFVPCSPGEFSPQDGISSTESPCTPCQPGYYSPDFLSVECLPCMVRWPMPRNARPTVTGRMPCQTTHVTEPPPPPPARAGWHISGQSWFCGLQGVSRRTGVGALCCVLLRNVHARDLCDFRPEWNRYMHQVPQRHARAGTRGLALRRVS